MIFPSSGGFVLRPCGARGFFPNEGFGVRPLRGRGGIPPVRGRMRPPFLFLPAGEKEMRRARWKEKEGLGAEMVEPCFSFGLGVGRSLYQLGAGTSP